MNHSTAQLFEYADLLGSVPTHDDMRLSILLSQVADLLIWAAQRIETLEDEIDES